MYAIQVASYPLFAHCFNYQVISSLPAQELSAIKAL